MIRGRLSAAAALLALSLTGFGCEGPAGDVGDPGADGTTCTVAETNGVTTITCEDGTTATVNDGEAGASCTVTDNNDGTKTITCDDGTEVTVADGSDGDPGEDGENGLPGEQGPPGEQGEPGESGVSTGAAEVLPGVNYLAVHDADAPAYDPACISCHANMPTQPSLDEDIMGFHGLKLTSGIIPGDTFDDQCIYCHTKVDLAMPAGNLRRHVDVGVCTPCHAGGDVKLYLAP